MMGDRKKDDLRPFRPMTALIDGHPVALAQDEASRTAGKFDTDQLHDLLEGKTSAERKEYPVKTGFIDYFRDAIFRCAKVSYDGNRQHNPGEPTHWARGKSDDHMDCLARHMMAGDEEEHLANAFWRAGAELQLFLEKKYKIKPPPGCW